MKLPVQRHECLCQLLGLTHVAEQLQRRGANDGYLLSQLNVVSRIVYRRVRSQVDPSQDLATLADR